MEDLEALRLRKIKAQAAYVVARDAYHAALCAAYPFRVDDIIRSATGNLAMVTKVYVQFDRAGMIAVTQKKDGTFDMRIAALWRDEWRNPQLHSRPDAAA